MLKQTFINQTLSTGKTLLGRQVRGALIALMAVFVLPFVAFVGTASAGSPTCSSGYVCLWQHADYNGTKHSVRVSPQSGCWGLSGFNDTASSIANRISYGTLFFAEALCQEGWLWEYHVSAGSNVPNLSGSGLNDEISSFQVCNPVSACY
jgi:hypothetical protein